MELDIFIAPAARDDLDNAARYLAQRNPEAAIKLFQQFDHLVDLMHARPFMGPAVASIKFIDMRKATMPPYVVYYRVTESAIEIVRILHHARESERQKL